MASAPAWVRGGTYSAIWEAEMARGILEGAGIPARISSDAPGVFGAGWSGTVPRGVELFVPREREDDARAVLMEI